MPADTLTTFYQHHLWANLRLLEVCDGLTNDQLNTTIPGAPGTLWETLVHIVMAERAYFSRISTGQMYQHPEDAPALTLAEMMKSVQETGAGFVAWAAKVQAGDTVTIDWDGTPREVPKTIILTQVILHATEHREQVKAILTELGIEPPDLQSWAYFDEVDR